MLTLLLEDQLAVLIGCILLVVVPLLVFMQTRRLAAILATGVAVLLGAGALLVEQLVVTQTEQIEATLHTIAQDAIDGDAAAVIQSIDPSAEATRQLARVMMDRYQVQDVSIKHNLSVTFTNGSSPVPRAEARVNVVVTAGARGGGSPVSLPRVAALQLVRRNGRWLVQQCEFLPFNTRTRE